MNVYSSLNITTVINFITMEVESQDSIEPRDEMLEFFNEVAISSPYLKVVNVADLILGQLYLMHTLENKKTRYGFRLLITLYLNNVSFGKVWLPEKYKAIAEKFDIEEYNARKDEKKYNLMYCGLSATQGFEMIFKKVSEK
jgi:hypothetical protein